MNQSIDEVKTQDKQSDNSEHKEPEGKLEKIRNSLGPGQREIVRAASGRFVKNAKKREQDLAKSERSQDRLRDLLSRPREGKKKSLEIELAEKLADNILNSTNEDLSGAAKAYEILETRAWGRPAPSEQEKDALSRAGVTVVIVPTPAGLPVVEEKEAQKPPLLKPAWVETNPAKNSDQVKPEELNDN